MGGPSCRMRASSNTRTLGRSTPAEALIVTEKDEPAVERFVEIRDFSTGGRLVAVIEVLSPGDKQRGMSRELYLQKRHELRDARVHLVEIDLLRGGQPMEPVLRTSLAPEYQTHYLITVTREEPGITNGRQYEIYKVWLRERLPVIRIPLRPTDPDALLDVQAVLNDAYARGGYDIIDYNNPPEPPLADEDTTWTRELLHGAGRV